MSNINVVSNENGNDVHVSNGPNNPPAIEWWRVYYMRQDISNTSGFSNDTHICEYLHDLGYALNFSDLRDYIIDYNRYYDDCDPDNIINQNNPGRRESLYIPNRIGMVDREIANYEGGELGVRVVESDNENAVWTDIRQIENTNNVMAL